MKKYNMFAAAQLLVIFFGGGYAPAQTPPDRTFCGPAPQPAFCSAVRGARAEGWPAQSRSEVMAQHASGTAPTGATLARFNSLGGVQLIMRGNEYYRAGSDFRKDGEAVGW